MMHFIDPRSKIALYCGDCRDVLPSLDPKDVALVLADPPYGIALKTAYKGSKRTALAPCNDFPPIYGDDQPFDPTHLLRFPRLILFGANYYAERLPASPSWLIWDKLDGLQSKRELGFNDNADAEMAWTNLGGPARLLPHRWMGCMKASERDERRVHPTQKPVALMERLIELFTQPGDLVLDPYMGSGTTMLAAQRLGRRGVGIEMSPDYFEITRRRLLTDPQRLSEGVG